MQGPSSAGKVVYVTATLPYLLITILLGYGLTLDGAWDGIVYFLKPDMSKLLEINIWVDAAVQVMYQLGPAWGGIITMASYNDFKCSVYKDALGITIGNLFTALYSGLAIFSILGFMANRYGVPVEAIAKGGPGLAYVAYPEAIAQMPFSPFWAIMFFVTLITVGIDSQFGMFDTLVSGILDTFPKLRRRTALVTGLFAILWFTLGLPFCTRGGIYLYQIFDWYAPVLTFTVVAFLEIILVPYVYGMKRLCFDAAMMFGFKPQLPVRIFWLFITPVVVGALFFIGLANLSEPTYTYPTIYHYPSWAIVLGWCCALFSCLPIPIALVYVLITTKWKSWPELYQKCLKPTPEWLPGEPGLDEEYAKRWYPETNDSPLNGDDSSIDKHFEKLGENGENVKFLS